MFEVQAPQHTEGIVRHTGRLIVARLLGTPAQSYTVTLPDDFKALVARVAALEAAASGANSLEDLTYGG